MKQKWTSILCVCAVLALLLLAACETNVTAPDGRVMDADLVWIVIVDGSSYDVYEFTDLVRGEHCYVIKRQSDAAVGLSCEKIGR